MSNLDAEPVQWLKDKVVWVQFTRLVELGCDADELLTALVAIESCAERPQEEQGPVPAIASNSQPQEGEPVPIPLVPISLTFEGEIGFDRSELGTVIKRLRQCAVDLKRLKVRRIRDILSEKYRFPPQQPGWFPSIEGRPTLGDVLAELQEEEPKSPRHQATPPQDSLRPLEDSSNLMWLRYQEEFPWRLQLLARATEEAARHVYTGLSHYDGAVMSLVTYVHGQTHGYRDNEVSALIEAVRGKHYDAEAHRHWRRRHSKLFQ